MKNNLPNVTGSWSKKDLKNGYRVSYGTLQEWILKIPGFMTKEEYVKRRIFNPLESGMIFTHIGHIAL